MKNKILGSIAILWGGGIIIRWLITDPTPSGNSAFDAGYSTAVIFGMVMLVVGLYYAFKKS